MGPLDTLLAKTLPPKESTTWIKINQLQPTDVTLKTHCRKPMFPTRSVRVLTEVKNVNVSLNIECLKVMLQETIRNNDF